MLTNFKNVAADLPQAWRSVILAKAGGANLKILRMDEVQHEAEVHQYAEALIVIDGCMKLSVNNRIIEVRAGEMYVVPAGLPHGVSVGSRGTLLIVDPVSTS